MNIRDKWNTRYAQVTDEPKPARVLEENLHLLAHEGRALDLACGRGGNAILLANLGLQVDAWDISNIAIDALAGLAAERDLNIHVQVRDVENNPPEHAQYDAVVVSYFLYRPLFPALIETLRPGGLLYYQTFIRERVSDRGPASEAVAATARFEVTGIPGRGSYR